jgi:hypothetical protein
MRRIAALVLCLAALPALAADPALVRPDQVLASVTGDFNDDALPDRAVLVESEPFVDLLIFAGDGTGGMAEAARGEGMIWTGEMWGTFPALELDEDGQLIAIHQNESVGRDRWREVFTIGWHGGAFAVLRYGWESYDSLDPETASACEVDFLTGEASRDGDPLRAQARPVPVAEWEAASKPALCTD